MPMKRKKVRTQKKKADPVDPTATPVPKSFVMPSGKVSRSAQHLVGDIRRMMEPNTATNLKARMKNKLKDFLDVAGPMGVTHFVWVSQSETATNMRIARCPKGPTLSFQLEQYALIKDVLALQVNPRSPGKEYTMAPLLVLNKFDLQMQHVKLMATMFQNMFPSLNVEKMHVNECRRVVMVNFLAERDMVEVRHYYISVKAVGVSKSLKRIIQKDDIPDLHRFNDISEYVLKDAVVSESDVEDANVVTLPEKYIGKNNRGSQQRAIKLVEIGPRINMRLIKIQDGFCKGDTIYHAFRNEAKDFAKEDVESDIEMNSNSDGTLEDED